MLNGSKIWTSLGSYAKYMILLARTNPQKPRYDGLSFFLVPMKTSGIEPQPIKKLTGEYGFTQTFFTDARIPAECLMGKEGEGWKIAMLTLTFERGVDRRTGRRHQPGRARPRRRRSNWRDARGATARPALRGSARSATSSSAS